MASQDPLGYLSTTVYDAAAQAPANVDALGNRTSSVYDATGRVIARQDARGYRTSFVFDAAGRQLAVVDANGHRTSSLYDARGMVQATQDPLGAYTTYQFDGVGNTLQRVDARNWPTTYTVDALNRLTGWAYLNGTRCTYTFDPDGRQLTMLDVTGITTTTYDTLGRATAVMNPTGVPITFTFDCLGNQIETSMTSYYDTKFTYDAQSRVVGLRNVYGERTTLTYDALDRETQRVLGNSVAVSKSYDAAGREMLISSPVAVYTATYDAVGNRLTVAELGGSLVTYSYDASYQLTREQRSGAAAIDESFVYDGLGNRLTKTDTTGITTCTYNAANAVPASTAPSGVITTSSYDANGNLTLENAGGALTTYAWDGDNHLTLASAAGNVQTNTYSADGMRFERIVNGTSRRYVRNGENVRGEIKTNAGAAAIHEDLPGIWGGKFTMRWNGGSYYVVPDFQGNTRFLLDSAGAVTDSLITDAWGVELARTGSLETPFLAFGQWGYFRDTASRLYVRARHLRVDQGRWVSKDPIGELAGDPNEYRYVRNRILARTDPTGLVGPIACIGCGLCVVGGIAGLISCSSDPRGVPHCLMCWCMRNPVACGALAVGCGVACVACMPWLAAQIAHLRALLAAGGALAPVPAYAATGAGGGEDPCDDCTPKSIACQAHCSLWMGRWCFYRGQYGGNPLWAGTWYGCCLRYCSDQGMRCRARPPLDPLPCSSFNCPPFNTGSDPHIGCPPW